MTNMVINTSNIKLFFANRAVYHFWGRGPDCYLLPTDNTLILEEEQYTHVEVEPLFADVQLAMQNGLFYDVTK